MEENFTFVPDMTFYHNISSDKMIEQASKYPFTTDFVLQLEKEYSAKHKKDL